MQTYKAIISDVDGTLTPNGHNALPSPKVIEAINKIKPLGITLVLATGRPLSLLKYLLDYLEVKGLVIFDNGAGIYNMSTRKTIWEVILDSNIVNEILQIAKSVKHLGTGLSLNNNSLLNDVNSVSENAGTRKLIIMGLIPMDADNLLAKLKSQFKTISITKASSWKGDDLIDIYVTHPEATKQHAVFKVAEILKISTKEIIAIGDHYNDYPLFMACGLKVAMGNAVQDLKDIADYIAPSVNDDGFVDVVEKYILK